MNTINITIIRKAKITDHGLPSLINAKIGIKIIGKPINQKYFFSQTKLHNIYILYIGIKAFHLSRPFFSNILLNPNEDKNHVIKQKTMIITNQGMSS